MSATSLDSPFSNLPPEQVFLESLLNARSSLFFLQIGANDGQDFVGALVRRYRRIRNIGGLLVEPQPYFCERLQATYADVKGVRILNCAISDRRGSRTLYHVDYNHRDLPAWTKGLGTLRKDVLLSHANLVSSLDSRIRELQVACITVADLLRMIGDTRIDVLITDTEGYDFVILKQFDFATVRPQLIVYESKHLSADDFESCERLLSGFGYRVVHFYNDNSAALLNGVSILDGNAGIAGSRGRGA